MGSRKDCIYIGLDTCENLMKQAKPYQNCSYIVGNCIDLPFESNSFIMLCLLLLFIIYQQNHVDYKQLRNKSNFKKDGEALIYVWAYEQPRFENETSQDVNVNWMLQKKYSEKKEHDEIFYRYYHLFKKNELETLISHITTLEIIETGNQYNNWYCIVKKRE